MKSLRIQSTISGRISDGLSPSQPSVDPVAQGSGKQVTPLACLFCNGTHSLKRCFKFRDKTYDERKEFVLTKSLCVNCLRTSHLARRCRFAKACLFCGCGRRHHSLLHPPPAALEGVERPASCTTQETSPEDIPRNGASRAGQLQDVHLAESLGVSGKPIHFSLSSINAENTPKSGYEVALNVVALDVDDTILLDKVWTVDRLPISKRSVPSDEDASQWPHLKGIKSQDLMEKRLLAYLSETMCQTRIGSMKRDVEDENSHMQSGPPRLDAYRSPEQLPSSE
ncbi:hypothetical protein ACROYT_G013739 [Oculina patagonica]